MMQIITLAAIKSNSRIDGNIEDSILETYGESAEAMVESMMERSWDSVLDEYGYIPAPLVHACLELVDHWYHYRGIVSTTALYNVPYTIDALIKPYVQL